MYHSNGLRICIDILHFEGKQIKSVIKQLRQRSAETQRKKPLKTKARMQVSRRISIFHGAYGKKEAVKAIGMKYHTLKDMWGALSYLSFS